MTELQHVHSSEQFSLADLDLLFARAAEIKAQILRDPDDDDGILGTRLFRRRMVTLFEEPSSRTVLSFSSAMVLLGGSVISLHNTSREKGESWEDTAMTISMNHPHVLVVRLSKEKALKKMLKVSTVPIIGGGQGTGQHVTQGMLDVFTLLERMGSLDGKHIALCGDLKNGRTVHSLSILLGLYPGIKLTLVSHKALQMPEWVMQELSRQKVSVVVTDNFQEVARDSSVDVLYLTRDQDERKSGNDSDGFGSCRLTDELIATLGEHTLVAHPLPRVEGAEEMPPTFDGDGRALYWNQVENGVFVRGALLEKVLGVLKAA
ncbi:MAG: aspartate carbamoyltransferase [Candidatus Jacksonbacteria bacterium]|jgi:aspartate carbamoyltransferase catalytic subunit|nr:aspartate carbamoyltransferase [Candidatus Jacksonbacteria bacterium]